MKKTVLRRQQSFRVTQHATGYRSASSSFAHSIVPFVEKEMKDERKRKVKNKYSIEVKTNTTLTTKCKSALTGRRRAYRHKEACPVQQSVTVAANREELCQVQRQHENTTELR